MTQLDDHTAWRVERVAWNLAKALERLREGLLVQAWELLRTASDHARALPPSSPRTAAELLVDWHSTRALEASTAVTDAARHAYADAVALRAWL